MKRSITAVFYDLAVCYDLFDRIALPWLDLAQHKGRVHNGNERQAGQTFAVYPVIIRHVAGDHAQHVIRTAACEVTLQNILCPGNRFFELLQRLASLGIERDVHEHMQRQPQLFAVDAGSIAFDDTGRLQRLDPPVARRGRKTKQFRKLCHRPARVRLKCPQNRRVLMIHKISPFAGIVGDQRAGYTECDRKRQN
ncbi:MAG: hypothetical protein ACI853_002018 [Paracoccaceae bacterium]|jgi:hypothetical protein